MPAHPLAAVLDAAAHGSFPPVDGGVEVLPTDASGRVAVVAFTGHSYVLADVDPAEVAARAPDGGFGASLDPAFLVWLAGDRHEAGRVDAILVRRGTGIPGDAVPADAVPVDVVPADAVPETDAYDAHPRVVTARRLRRDVRTFGDARGVVFLGTGLAGRRELGIELADPAAAAPGTGRRLIAAGLARVPSDELVWAQVTPGNARSLRAVLAAGFVPVGSEALSIPRD